MVNPSVYPLGEPSLITRSVELSIAPHLNNKMIPPHARPALEARGLGLDTFKPLTKEEMIAHLD